MLFFSTIPSITIGANRHITAFIARFEKVTPFGNHYKKAVGTSHILICFGCGNSGRFRYLRTVINSPCSTITTSLRMIESNLPKTLLIIQYPLRVAFKECLITTVIKIMVPFLFKSLPLFYHRIEIFHSLTVLRTFQLSIRLKAISCTLQIDTHQQCTGSSLRHSFGTGRSSCPIQIVLSESKVRYNLVINHFPVHTFTKSRFVG